MIPGTGNLGTKFDSDKNYLSSFVAFPDVTTMAFYNHGGMHLGSTAIGLAGGPPRRSLETGLKN